MPPAKSSAWLTLIAFLCCTVSAAFGQDDAAKRDQALNLVSESPAVVVLVPNMDKFAQKLAAFNDRIGGQTSALSDVLGEFKRTSGMVSGVEDAGAMMLVLPNAPTPDTMQKGGQFIMLMPVSNYQEFVVKLQGDPGKQVTAVKLGNGFKGYSRLLSGYAVLGESEEAVTNYTPARNASLFREVLGPLGSTYLDKNDAAVMLNMEKLRPMILPALQSAMQESMSQIEAASMQRQISRSKAQETRTLLNLYASAIRPLVTDSQMVTFGLDVTDQGIATTITASFKPGSTTAAVLTNGGSARKLLNQLPNQGYISATAIDFGAIHIETIADGIEWQIAEIDDGGTLKLVRMAIPLLRMTNGAASAYYTPPPGAAMMGGNLLNTVTVFSVDDGPAYRTAFRGYINGMRGIQTPAMVEGPDGEMMEAPIIFDADYSPNTLNIDTIDVDQYSVRYTLPSEMMQTQTGSAIMLAGGSAQTGYVANRDNYVVTTTTATAQVIKSALSAVDPEVPGLGSLNSIQAIEDDGMTPEPFFATVLSVRGMASTVRTFVGMMSPESQEKILVPEDLPPVAFSASLKNSNFAGRAYIPVPVIVYAGDLYEMMTRPEEVEPETGPNRGPIAGPQGPQRVQQPPQRIQQQPQRVQQQPQRAPQNPRQRAAPRAEPRRQAPPGGGPPAGLPSHMR